MVVPLTRRRRRLLPPQAELALLRMHNMSLPRHVYEGHMIKATVLEVRMGR